MPDVRPDEGNGADEAIAAADRAEQAEQGAREAERGAEQAEQSAEQAERGALDAELNAERAAGQVDEETEQVEALLEKFEDEGDPLLDQEIHGIVAGVSDEHPFGVPGPPMDARSPFWVAASATLGVLVVVLVAESVVKARSAIVLIFVSAFLAIGLNPLVEILIRRGITRRAAVALISLGFLLFFVGAGFAIAQPIAHQGSQLTKGLPAEAAHLRETNKTFRDLDKRFQLVDKIDSVANSSAFKSTVKNGVIGAAGRPSTRSSTSSRS